MTHRTRNLIVGGVSLAVLAAAAAIGISMLRTAVQTSLEAENRFHAAIIVHTAIAHFESANQRRPVDWDELTAAGPIDSGGMGWPRDRATIQQLVEVDFSELRLADPASDAIHPTGIIYEGWESIVLDQPEQQR